MVGKSIGNNMKCPFQIIIFAIVFLIGVAFFHWCNNTHTETTHIIPIAAPEQYTYLSANVLPNYAYVITWQRVGDRHCETIVYPIKQSYKSFKGESQGRVISITTLPNEQIVIWAHDENDIQTFCETIVYPLVDQEPSVENGATKLIP